MKAIILSDLKAVILSKRFWIAVGLIVISSAFTSITTFLFEYDVPSGFLEIFIFATIGGVPMMNFLAPFIPAIVFGPLIVDNMQTDAGKKLWQKTGIKKSLAAHSVSSAITGAGIFMVAHVIVMACCFVYDPTISEIEHIASGIFAEVFSASVPMYIVLFILYVSFFGAVYAFFSMGIGLATKSYSMAMVLPGIIYHASSAMWVFLDSPILSWVNILLPGTSYGFESDYPAAPILDKVAGFGCIILAAAVLVIAAYKRMKRTPGVFIDESAQKKKEI